MAVAVKTSPGARFTGSLASPAILSLIGVLYLLGCLGIVFKLVPSLWWPAWDGLGWGSAVFVGGTLLLLLCLAVGVGLLWIGARLLGPNPPPGVRAGVFVGFVGLLGVVLLTRWASLWIEYFAYHERSLTPSTGAILTGIVGFVLLLAWLRFFTWPWTQNNVLGLEAGGWFHATSYKGNQGMKVRRGTIFGLLLLVLAGIYSLVSHGTLRRGATDWVVNVPFTGQVVVESIGDAEKEVAALPAADKTQVQVRWAGASALSGLQTKQFLSPEAFKEKVNALLDDLERGIPGDQADRPGSVLLRDVKKKLNDSARDDIVDYLLVLNHQIHRGLRGAMTLRAGRMSFLREDVLRRLDDLDNRTDWTDIGDLLAAVEKDVDAAVARLKREDELAARARKDTEQSKASAEDAADKEKAKERQDLLADQAAYRWAFKLPTAAVLVDRYALLKADAELKPSARIRVGLNRNPNFALKEGEVVSTARFGQEEVRLYSAIAARLARSGTEGKKALANLREAQDGAQFKALLNEYVSETNPPLKTQLEDIRTRIRDEIIPEQQTLVPATGVTRFASIPLLPSVQFTVPLLLLAASLWLSWRVVNMPAFADFLIATEAELNKVSWTTQRKLAQDTVVVLATVFLMAVFLFTMDYFWKTVLSWKPIGVLHIPEDSGKQKQKLEEKRW